MGELPRPIDQVRVGMKPGDWSCPTCGDLVFASKSACKMCGTTKQQAGVPDTPRQNWYAADQPQQQTIEATAGQQQQGGDSMLQMQQAMQQMQQAMPSGGGGDRSSPYGGQLF